MTLSWALWIGLEQTNTHKKGAGSKKASQAMAWEISHMTPGLFSKTPQPASRLTSQFDEGRDNIIIKTHTVNRYTTVPLHFPEEK